MSTLETMWLRAWIDGLHRVNDRPVRAVEHPTGAVLLPAPTWPTDVPPQRTTPR